ncbi:hypothetical protein J5N97_001927 [Dioscorea zingiberensis]|uniref:Pentatricopeptide repeat-containing protein n=1 Tax=Dioscorea zingiberensis TaxID=325984 RepID=A0A9D5BT33_9LILI|nr:hypothetical protein J5N97_001927 [Dioscorea zingiberensis]
MPARDVAAWNSMIHGYFSYGRVGDAKKLFEVMPGKNAISWTSMIAGLDQNGRSEEALVVFGEMVASGVQPTLTTFGDMMISGVIPNQSSFTSALNSCFGLEDLHRGKEIHAATVKLGFETDAFVGNSLIVLYAKCGSINDGVAIFKRIGEKNIVSWNSTVIGCAQHGCGKWALALFNQMLRAGVDPDEITFTGLLSACSHSGMLQKARGFSNFYLRLNVLRSKLSTIHVWWMSWDDLVNWKKRRR